MTTPQPEDTTVDLPMIISVDDHVIEPPHVWTRWLPEKYREQAPRVERRRIRFGGVDISFSGKSSYHFEDDPDGEECDLWVFGDLVVPQTRLTAGVGAAILDGPTTYDEMRPSCYDPKARVEEMIANHTAKSVCFPQFPRFCGQTFYDHPDKELGLACIKAYNDFMIEEWCGDSGGALIPLCIIPLWDPDLAIEEVKRNAERGCHAVAFSEIVAHLGLPSIHSGHWDKFFAACEEHDVAIFMHIGSSSRMPRTSADAPPMASMALTFQNAAASVSDFIFSGLLERHPRLRLCYAESQIGWLPYLLEKIDDVFIAHRDHGRIGDRLAEKPSFYYHRQIFNAFFRDFFGVESLGKIGSDSVVFETDFPHADTTWPNTKEIATQMLAGVPADDVYKIVRGNAERLLSLTPSVV